VTPPPGRWLSKRFEIEQEGSPHRGVAVELRAEAHLADLDVGPRGLRPDREIAPYSSRDASCASMKL
jgi:hypothetical protein